MTAPFLTHKQCLIARYGAPLYRVPVSFGFGCPNRDPHGQGGCAFCDESGASSIIAQDADDMAEQVRRGVDFARSRYGAKRFMAYVQSFTGTFAPVNHQRALYAELLSLAPFDALCVATRPDCLSSDTLALLAELRQRLDVLVELGVQTVHDATLHRIGRGHDWECSRRAIGDLAARDLLVVAHVILGLPGETRDHFRQTAEALARLPLAGVKLHNLHVLRGTRMAAEFARAPFPVYGPEDYADVVIDCIRRLPPNVAVMRINTDSPPARLIAPRWEISKGQFRDVVMRMMRARGVRQGDLFLKDL
ncbi:MAG: TIGR01212 family radical SAM protein, partial [Lysobacterales bacterium]